MHIQTSDFITILDHRMKTELFFDSGLKELKIPHIDVEFHKLFNDDDMQQWMKILEFLGKPKLVTAEDRNKSMNLESISFSTNDLEKSISNFEEVRDTVKGSN